MAPVVNNEKRENMKIRSILFIGLLSATACGDIDNNKSQARDENIETFDNLAAKSQSLFMASLEKAENKLEEWSKTADEAQKESISKLNAEMKELKAELKEYLDAGEPDREKAKDEFKASWESFRNGFNELFKSVGR